MDLVSLKTSILGEFRVHLEPIVVGILSDGLDRSSASKKVNDEVALHRLTLLSKVLAKYKTPKDIQQAVLVLQYCTSVVSLEYRHRVWPYEYMALSRRNGELWERFCLTAWDYPSLSGV